MILEVYTRIFVSFAKLSETLNFYKNILNGEETLHFAYPEKNLEIAAISSPKLSVLILAGDEESLEPFRATQLTIKVASLDQYIHTLIMSGSEQLEPVQKTPTGEKTRFRHPDGSIVEEEATSPDAIVRAGLSTSPPEIQGGIFPRYSHLDGNGPQRGGHTQKYVNCGDPRGVSMPLNTIHKHPMGADAGRVVDASIVPTQMSAHLSAALCGMAEKISELIRLDYKSKHQDDTQPYPAGYTHDLSLITNRMPDLTSPPGYPQVTGWGNYAPALDGRVEVYCVCQRSDQGKWRDISGEIDPTLFKRASVLGSGWRWDRNKNSQCAFLLWHTAGQVAPADGWSGSPLCLGSVSDTTAQAVVFQNFQTLRSLQAELPGQENNTLIKGGFLLPTGIRNSTIISVPREDAHGIFSTLPTRNRASTDVAPERRSFSAI
ncbi:hypothetical protein N7492_004662 [Penicillium capsulatum]|uniref:VOC domain-containing protein n=1 Tax=Penicillium capsulatum TaxID=69766 RepID=A0A9W9IAA0_9EURO|nr:hypothetical protein N7492_004662 [Penicillium capsulatum]KAJ6136226.1 hypothetical protein N7512_001386 [Penicillium capsulatum]